MEKASIGIALATEFARLEKVGVLDDVEAIYLFGSGRTRSHPRDIDLLVVWNETRLTPLEAAELRPTLITALGAAVSIPIDVTLLSRGEAESTRFAEHEGAELVYRRL